MNWDAIGAIGEVAGALGVVASLIYLAKQIRHNTRTVQGQTIGMVTQNVLGELAPFVGPDLSREFLLAITDPQSLQPEQRARLDAWMILSFTARQNEFLQHRLGALDADVWRSTHQAIRENLGHEWGRDWWDSVGRQRLVPEFVEFVESLDWRRQGTENVTAFLRKGGRRDA